MTAESLQQIARDLGWDSKVRLPDLWAPLLDEGAPVSFDLLVLAREQIRKSEGELSNEAQVAERALRRKFEKQYGPIQIVFYCSHVRGGCALTERRRDSGHESASIGPTQQPLGAVEQPTRKLHTALNSDVSDLVSLEAKCVILTEDAAAAFDGRRSLLRPLRRSTEMAYSVMTRVLAAADKCDIEQSTESERVAAVAVALGEYDLTAKQVDALIQREARFVYFQGVIIGTTIVSALATVLGVISATYWAGVVNTPALLAAIVFGALGSLTSVFQRMSRGQLRLDFTAARWQILLLGSFRPFIGAIFGTVVQFALGAGLLGVSDVTSSQSFGVFALIGFVSGFSERFATDMIERAGQVITATDGNTTGTDATATNREGSAT